MDRESFIINIVENDLNIRTKYFEKIMLLYDILKYYIPYISNIKGVFSADRTSFTIYSDDKDMMVGLYNETKNMRGYVKYDILLNVTSELTNGDLIIYIN